MCSFGAGLGIWFQINTGKQASTIIRKYFHVLAVAVFTSGIFYDTTLLYLSSGGVLAVFIVLEVRQIFFQKFLKGSVFDSTKVDVNFAICEMILNL